MSVEEVRNSLILIKRLLADSTVQVNIAIDQLDNLPSPEPNPGPTPTPSPSFKRPNGIFILKPGESNRSVSEDLISLPQIDGYSIRFRPTDLASNLNQALHWRHVDEEIEKCERQNKRFTLLCMSGGTNEPWLPANLAVYLRIIKEAGEQYSNHPLCVGWHITGCTPGPNLGGSSEELHWPNGKFDDKVLQACKQLTLASAQAFPNCTILQAISAKDRSGRMQQLIAYGKDVAPGRYLVKHNALKSIEIDARHNQLVIAAGTDPDIQIGWEMVSPTAETMNGKPRAGTRDINDCLRQAATMAKRAGEDPKNAYVAIYQGDATSVNPSILRD